MRMALISVIAFFCSICVLQIEYPWATYYGHFKFGWWPTMISYFLVAALLGSTAGIAAHVFLKRPSKSVLIGAVYCALSVLGIAVLLALFFGPAGVDIPGTQVRGIFFAEFQFLNFVSYVAVPVSAIVALLFVFAAQWHRRN
jgi:hypothetical protein